MKYTVLWTPAAEERLAGIWLDAQHRRAIADAANLLDEALADAPLSIGESREGSMRVAFAYPLGVEYDVSPDDRTVYVLAVWSFE
jgi:hypothetical protein